MVANCLVGPPDVPRAWCSRCVRAKVAGGVLRNVGGGGEVFTKAALTIPLLHDRHSRWRNTGWAATAARRASAPHILLPLRGTKGRNWTGADLIRVVNIEKASAAIADVSERDQKIAGELVLDGEIPFVDGGQFQIGRNNGHAGSVRANLRGWRQKRRRLQIGWRKLLRESLPNANVGTPAQPVLTAPPTTSTQPETRPGMELEAAVT